MIACIILAGGLGTRLRSILPQLPKCLAPVLGRPFLEWQIRSLHAQGIKNFVLGLGYGSNLVEEALSQPWASDFSIKYVVEKAPLGTGGAASLVMNKLGLDEALVINGDTLVGGEFSSLLRPLDTSDSEFLRIGSVVVKDRSRFGGLVTDLNGRVIDLLEKTVSGPGLINAGFYRVHRKAFDGESTAAFSLENSTMRRLARSRCLTACELNGPFIDVGVPEDYKYFCDNVFEFQI
jgi:D-glycero-alpha-D-manno-heptose 1-phosphate guanylyltransferase